MTDPNETVGGGENAGREAESFTAPTELVDELNTILNPPELPGLGLEAVVGTEPHRPLEGLFPPDEFPPDGERRIDAAELKRQLEPIAEAEFMRLLSKEGNFIWASDSLNFDFAFFGRDTEKLVKDLAAIEKFRPYCIKFLISLARFQGTSERPVKDEHRGAFLHELRGEVFDGEPADEHAVETFRRQQKEWNDGETDADGSVPKMNVYYGEIDGAARFIQACAALAKNRVGLAGVDLANEKFDHVDTKIGERSLLDACREAVVYIRERIAASDLGLVELQPPQNPHTLTNQPLKDSKPAYLHKIDGKPVLPNREKPRAYLEAQVLSYEALLDFAALVGGDEARDVLTMAEALKRNTLDNFVVEADTPGFDWPEGRPYLTAMLDRDPETGDVRKLNTIMLDPAESLGRMFDERPDLKEAITLTAFSDDFLTDVGLRCRGLRDGELFDFAEYHGSLPNWIVLTHTVAKRLHDEGSPRLAQELWTRMIAGLVAAGSFQEFIYVDKEGNPLLPERSGTNEATIGLRAEEHSQTNQAWSISAMLEALEYMEEIDESVPMSDLERRILGEDGTLSADKQYRGRFGELLAQLREKSKHYLLDKAEQYSTAHEVVIPDIFMGASPIYELTAEQAAQLRLAA